MSLRAGGLIGLVGEWKDRSHRGEKGGWGVDV